MHDLNIIPVFPLPIVVFPEEEVRLHIFEPRYKELIIDCSKNNLIFGILPVVNNMLMATGTIVSLEEIVKTYEDGRMDVKLKSDVVFKMHQFIEKYPGKLYSAAKMETLNSDYSSDHSLTTEVMNLFNQLCEINNVKPFHPITWDYFTSYKLGHYAGFTLEEEYQFLELISENDRMIKLKSQLQLMIATSKLRLEWTKRLSLNGEFRNFKID